MHLEVEVACPLSAALSASELKIASFAETVPPRMCSKVACPLVQGIVCALIPLLSITLAKISHRSPSLCRGHGLLPGEHRWASAKALLTTELLSDLREVGVACKRATMAATSSARADE